VEQPLIRLVKALAQYERFPDTTDVHPAAVVRMHKLRESRIEGVREALKDVREAFTRWKEADNTQLPNLVYLEQWIAAISALLARSRTQRVSLESQQVYVSGQERRGGGETDARSYREVLEPMQRQKRALREALEGQRAGLGYAEALRIEEALRMREGELGELRTRHGEVEAAFGQMQRENEIMKTELAQLQDTCRLQRAQLLSDSSQGVGGGGGGEKEDRGEDVGEEGGGGEGQQKEVDGQHYAIRRIGYVGTENEDLVAGWNEEESRRISEIIQSNQDSSELWHSRYTQLCLAVQQEQTERAELEREQRRLQDKLEGFGVEREALHKGYQDQLVLLNDHLIKQGELIAAKDNDLSLLLSNRIKCQICSNWNSVKWLSKNGNGKTCQYGAHPSGYNFAKK
jgi:hypothetical protein